MAGVPSTTRLLLAADLLLLFLAMRLPASRADANSLLQLKARITDNAGALRSWSVGTSPCNNNDANWAGVICNGGNVLGLNLEGMGLGDALDLRPLESIRSLRTLSFMNNNFAGPMPKVKELVGLRSIFLSGNRFTGTIHEDAFAGMGSLKKVLLSRNDFSGPIPKSLADVPKLLELRLDGNKFTGNIPDLRQEDLKVVNVANNDLEGPVPASLAAMKADMFAGNTKLCGAPLDAGCGGSTQLQLNPSSETPFTAKAASASASKASASKAEALPPAERPSNWSKPFHVLASFLGALVIAGVMFVALQHQRRNANRNFGPTPSIRQPASAAGSRGKDRLPEQHRDAADDYSSSDGTSARRAAEQGKLTFVREEAGRLFELTDLLQATAEVLGTTNLGVCYQATLTSSLSVVVKRFKEMNRVGREDFEEHMRRLGRLTHPNLLPLVAYYYRREEKLLITDYVPNKSLAHLLHGDGEKGALHWAVRLKIVKGVASALNYLYEELSVLTVPHGHLKSSNILLGDGFEPLLTDYALVPVMNQSHAAQLMVAFKSPERRQFGRSSKKSDVWSLGLLVLEILTGRPPSYEPQGKAGNGDDLAGVVRSTPEEEWLASVVDGGLAAEVEVEENKEEMVKLIKIGMACCEADIEKRWELKEAVDKITALK